MDGCNRRRHAHELCRQRPRKRASWTNGDADNYRIPRRRTQKVLYTSAVYEPDEVAREIGEGNVDKGCALEPIAVAVVLGVAVTEGLRNKRTVTGRHTSGTMPQLFIGCSESGFVGYRSAFTSRAAFRNSSPPLAVITLKPWQIQITSGARILSKYLRKRKLGNIHSYL
jgi:hypothetical protein